MLTAHDTTRLKTIHTRLPQGHAYFIYDDDSLATDWILAEFGASENGDTPFGPDPDIDLGQIVLQLDEAGTPTHRYLWGRAVDQILADDTVDDGSLEDVLWLLTDHQNTVRDMVAYDGVNNQWTVANHIVYEAFGNILSETDADADCLFQWTGRFWDNATDLQQNSQRWYGVETGAGGRKTRSASTEATRISTGIVAMTRSTTSIHLVSMTAIGKVWAARRRVTSGTPRWQS